MPIFYKKAALIAHLKSIKTPHSTLGFVPTMGALHQGHLSLIQQSLAENEHAIVSIFVNPTQFNNANDLEKYPRPLEADLKKLADLNPEIIVYAPSVEDVYEGKTLSQPFDFDGLENQMEGKFRPGHFNGVGTVVKRLFEIVEPTKAYFGEKDFQQLQIIRKMVAKNNLNIQIIGCPIYRDSNHLALSSRNELLSVEAKREAAFIYKTLAAAKEQFKTNSPEMVSKWVEKSFEENPAFKLDYFEIADEASLLTCTTKNPNIKYRAFVAAVINNVRLIDTLSFN